MTFIDNMYLTMDDASISHGACLSEPTFDEIGYWSEVKLDIVKKYAAAYSKIMSRQSAIRRHLYIDGFAGAGVHISKTTHEFVGGSPTNALLVAPPFSEFHFIDLDGTRAELLRSRAKSRSDVHVHHGDCNKILLENVFPRCSYGDFARGLCLLDPYGLNVNWDVLETAGRMRTIEVFYNFMIMDANMNVLLRNPARVSAANRARMDAVWGDRSWRDATYPTELDLFGKVERKASNEAVAEAFRRRLREKGGFSTYRNRCPCAIPKARSCTTCFSRLPTRQGDGLSTTFLRSTVTEGFPDGHFIANRMDGSNLEPGNGMYEDQPRMCALLCRTHGQALTGHAPTELYEWIRTEPSRAYARCSTLLETTSTSVRQFDERSLSRRRSVGFYSASSRCDGTCRLAHISGSDQEIQPIAGARRAHRLASQRVGGGEYRERAIPPTDRRSETDARPIKVSVL
jgi:three-Cys-motif partner protein